MSYTNADGLRILTNGGDGTEATSGTSNGAGQVRTLCIDLLGTAIGSSFGASNIDPNAPIIPANSLIINADFVVTAAFTSGGAATLTIGTYNSAGAAVDADGIDATVAVAAINTIGFVVQCDGAQVNGTLTVGTADCYVGAIYGTAAYTAGAGKLYIQYIKL